MKTILTLTLLILLPVNLSFRLSRFNSTPVTAYSPAEEIPTVDFCEVVKKPQLYFDKTVRLTAMIEQAMEAQYLSDKKCALSHDEQIGVGYVNTTEEQRDILNRSIRQIQSPEYGGHAIVTVIGILRNSSRRDFAWYHYRFDIIRFEDVSHVIVPYAGELQSGITYLAAVRGDSLEGLSLVIPLRMPEHYATRIEWVNLSDFPALKRLRDSSREQRIVFSVLSDERKQMTAQRWNRTLVCKVISVE